MGEGGRGLYLQYRRPREPEDESTRVAKLFACNESLSFAMTASNSGLFNRRNRPTLIGAIHGAKDIQHRASSPSRVEKACSSTAYMIRPIPKDGSITLGVNLRSKIVFFSVHCVVCIVCIVCIVYSV